KSKIIKLSRQTDTDVEKCIKFAISRKYDEVVLLGATGDRLDHTFGNLGIVLKYFKEITVRILHHRSYLSAYEGNICLNTHPDEIVSVYGIDKKTIISSDGLKYALKNISLPFGKKESTSNVALGDKLVLQIKGGIAFVIRDFRMMKKYDLFQ
ncbi:MAG: thiamine diphosphokinase, partial [Melioribacteraceae bacterium]